jgi:hypothetical protein
MQTIRLSGPGLHHRLAQPSRHATQPNTDTKHRCATAHIHRSPPGSSPAQEVQSISRQLQRGLTPRHRLGAQACAPRRHDGLRRRQLRSGGCGGERLDARLAVQQGPGCAAPGAAAIRGVGRLPSLPPWLPGWRRMRVRLGVSAARPVFLPASFCQGRASLVASATPVAAPAAAFTATRTPAFVLPSVSPRPRVSGRAGWLSGADRAGRAGGRFWRRKCSGRGGRRAGGLHRICLLHQPHCRAETHMRRVTIARIGFLFDQGRELMNRSASSTLEAHN